MTCSYPLTEIFPKSNTLLEFQMPRARRQAMVTRTRSGAIPRRRHGRDGGNAAPAQVQPPMGPPPQQPPPNPLVVPPPAPQQIPQHLAPQGQAPTLPTPPPGPTHPAQPTAQTAEPNMVAVFKDAMVQAMRDIRSEIREEAKAEKTNTVDATATTPQQAPGTGNQYLQGGGGLTGALNNIQHATIAQNTTVPHPDPTGVGTAHAAHAQTASAQHQTQAQPATGATTTLGNQQSAANNTPGLAPQAATQATAAANAPQVQLPGAFYSHPGGGLYNVPMAFSSALGDRVFQNPLTPAQYVQLPLGTVQGVQPPGLAYPLQQQQPVAQVSVTPASAPMAQQPSSVPSGTLTPAPATSLASPQDASGKDTPAPPPLPGKADLGVTYQCNPLDSLVPLKVKEKIWDEGKATSLEVEDKEEGPLFQFVHKSNKEITTHRRWTKAFLVFI